MDNNNPQIQAIVKALGGELLQTEYSWRWDFIYRGFTVYIEPVKDKFTIVVIPPKHNQQAYSGKADEAWRAATTEIGVGQSKTPEKIAGDITKRIDFDLLEQIKGMFAAADNEYIQMRIDHDNFVDSIVAKIGGKRRKTGELRSEISFYPLRLDIEINIKSVKIEINEDLGLDKIVALYQAIR